MTHTKGGGVALLYRKEYQVTKLENSNLFDTIEYGTWETTVNNRRIKIIGIYHPPIGTTTGNTHTKFLYEVSQLVQYFITDHQTVVLLGDLNIHTQALTNHNLLEYNDTMEALGLRQHIIEPTHKQGNTLDLST